MSALTDLVVTQTDPVTAVLLAVMLLYIRQLRNDFKEEHKQQRQRLRRLENELLDSDP